MCSMLLTGRACWLMESHFMEPLTAGANARVRDNDVNRAVRFLASLHSQADLRMQGSRAVIPAHHMSGKSSAPARVWTTCS